MKSASCTTTSLFIVIFSKNSFFIRSFKLCNCLATAFVLKSGCKGSQFYNTKQIFLWKMCSKTYCFRFVLQNRGEYGRFHLLYIYARERNCGRKQGWWRWRKKKTRSFPWGKGGKRGRERRYGWGVAWRGMATMWGKTQGKKKEMKLPDYIQEDTWFLFKDTFLSTNTSKELSIQKNMNVNISRLFFIHGTTFVVQIVYFTDKMLKKN